MSTSVNQLKVSLQLGDWQHYLSVFSWLLCSQRFSSHLNVLHCVFMLRKVALSSKCPQLCFYAQKGCAPLEMFSNVFLCSERLRTNVGLGNVLHCCVMFRKLAFLLEMSSTVLLRLERLESLEKQINRGLLTRSYK